MGNTHQPEIRTTTKCLIEARNLITELSDSLSVLTYRKTAQADEQEAVNQFVGNLATAHYQKCVARPRQR